MHLQWGGEKLKLQFEIITFIFFFNLALAFLNLAGIQPIAGSEISQQQLEQLQQQYNASRAAEYQPPSYGIPIVGDIVWLANKIVETLAWIFAGLPMLLNSLHAPLAIQVTLDIFYGFVCTWFVIEMLSGRRTD